MKLFEAMTKDVLKEIYMKNIRKRYLEEFIGDLIQSGFLPELDADIEKTLCRKNVLNMCWEDGYLMFPKLVAGLSRGNREVYERLMLIGVSEEPDMVYQIDHPTNTIKRTALMRKAETNFGNEFEDMVQFLYPNNEGMYKKWMRYWENNQ